MITTLMTDFVAWLRSKSKSWRPTAGRESGDAWTAMAAPDVGFAEGSRIIRSDCFFTIPPDLLRALRDHRASRSWVEPIETEYDAFLLDPGLGPATYLGSDGRILWDDDGWGVAGTRAEVYVAISVGARKTGIRELLSLLPKKPSDALDCDACEGTGRYISQLRADDGSLISFGCPTCGTLGWRSPWLDLSLTDRWES